MEQSDLLAHLTRVLESLGVRYFITGSTATIFYGEPRLTNDIDVVVDLSSDLVEEFCRRFPEDEFYVSVEAAADAVRRKGQFNIIHGGSGLKVDVIIPEATPFNQSRFAQARRVHAGEGVDPSFASPEDAIIKKMDYYHEGGSEKHLRDIAGILRTTSNEIDTTYIAHWAEQLGLAQVWADIQARMKRTPT